MKGQKCPYHFGLIRINTKIEVLEWKVSLYRLRGACSEICVEPAYPKAREFGYKTRIGFVRPTREFFEVFKKTGKHYSPYKITYIELVRCKFGQSKHDSYISIFDQIELAKKTPTTDPNIKTRNDEENHTEDKAFYYKHENLKKTIYPKARRMNTQIFIQEEWEINSATAIKGKTGIETIEDLKNFDIQEFWDTQDKPRRQSVRKIR